MHAHTITMGKQVKVNNKPMDWLYSCHRNDIYDDNNNKNNNNRTISSDMVMT